MIAKSEKKSQRMRVKLAPERQQRMSPVDRPVLENNLALATVTRLGRAKSAGKVEEANGGPSRATLEQLRAVNGVSGPVAPLSTPPLANVSELQGLIHQIGELGFDELEIEWTDFKLRIRNNGPNHGPSLERCPTKSTANGTRRALCARTADSPSLHIVNASHVGLLCLELLGMHGNLNGGVPVTANQVLCTIRALGLENDVRSPIKGKVVEIYVKDGEPVEYGQRILALEPESERSTS